MISFVIPALNEAAAIQAVVNECLATARKVGWEAAEVVVVDDGSSDGTGELAQVVGAKVLRHPAPGGYGRSLKDGIIAATHDTIVTLDADRTYPVDMIPRLVEEYNKGYDMVVGRRMGAAYRESILKMPLRIILRFLVEFTTGRPVPDINSGLRVFSRATLLPFLPRLCDTFSFSTSTTLAYLMTGKFLSYVEIEYGKRTGKSKVRLFRDALRTLQFIVQAIIYFNPLKIFILFAVLCWVGGGVLLMAALFTHILAFFLLGVGTFLVSIIVIALGLLAVQLKEIMPQ